MQIYSQHFRLLEILHFTQTSRVFFNKAVVKKILLSFGIMILMSFSTVLQARELSSNKLLEEYVKQGNTDKIQSILKDKTQNVSLKDLINRLKNPEALTISERKVYRDKFNDIVLSQASKFFKAKQEQSSIENANSSEVTINKTSVGQYYLTESITEYFGQVQDKYRDQLSYDNNTNNTQTLTQKWSNNDWANIGLHTSIYDSFNNEIESLQQNWDTISVDWVNLFKNINTYDGSNNILEIQHINWTDSGWVLIGRSVYTYDANNLNIEYSYQDWNGGSWVDNWDEVYTYDANNNNTSYESSYWDGSAWFKYDQGLYTYDVNNNLTTETYKYWGKANWVNSELDTYSYDGMNNQTEVIIQYWNLGHWANNFKAELTYNENNDQIGSLGYHWDGSKWVNYNRGTFSYDANRNNTVWTLEEKNVSTWNLVVRVTNTYDQITTGIIKANQNLPLIYKLSQNYPNPFNPSTKISYTIPERANVSLKIFDLLGREAAQLVNGEMEAGSHDIEFNAANLSSGTYFYRIVTDDFVVTKKMILLK